MFKSFSKIRALAFSHTYYNKYLSSVGIITASAESAAINTEPKWQLVAAAYITRTPIVCPPLHPIEAKYKELVEKTEIELSLKSDHEIRIMEDKIRSDLLSVGEKEEVSIEEAAKETAAEFEDASTAELKAFEFASTLTDADKSEDKSTINRALDRALVLAVKQQLGSQNHWIFPQTPWIPGETLRQSCERVIKNVCGSKLKVKVLGNSPCGFFKYKYPKEVRKQGFIGAKVFFFAGHVVAYDSEGLDKTEEFTNHLWLTHEELQSILGKSYYQAISKFLISDK